MRAIIPAAGVGERLRPLTLTKPKVLLPVAGKPILGHIYDRLIRSGIDEITVIVGHFGEQVKAYSCQNYSLKFQFVEQTERRGLGHAVGLGLDETTEPVLIILGDTILEMDYAAFVAQKENIIGVMPVTDPRRFGVVLLRDGWITRLVEKPEQPISNLAIAGIYLIQDGSKLKSAINHLIEHDIRTKNEYQLTDALQVMLNRGERFTTAPIEHCYDCGTWETLLETNRYLLSQRQDSQPTLKDSCLIPPAYIAPGVEIKQSVVGPNVSLSQGVKVYQSIISDAIVDENAIINRAVLEHTLIGANSVIDGTQTQSEVRNNLHSKLS